MGRLTISFGGVGLVAEDRAADRTGRAADRGTFRGVVMNLIADDRARAGAERSAGRRASGGVMALMADQGTRAGAENAAAECVLLRGVERPTGAEQSGERERSCDDASGMHGEFSELSACLVAVAPLFDELR